MVPSIEEISKKVAIDFKNIDIKSKNLLQILVCGSHRSDDDLEIIEQFRDKQISRGITGTFLMKDIKVNDDNKNEIELPPHEKMHLIWNQMKEGNSIPLFILFAGQSATESGGLNAEIQTIANDKEKIDCAYLFKIPNIKLVSYEGCFSHVKEVKDGEEFIIEAEKVVNACLRQAKGKPKNKVLNF